MKFGTSYDRDLQTKSKDHLLKELDKTDKEMIDLLSVEENVHKKVVVEWNTEGIRVIEMLWSLNSHEILHTGWNLAVMDHLDMERFPALKQIWG